jgi:hypothetical protein
MSIMTMMMMMRRRRRTSRSRSSVYCPMYQVNSVNVSHEKIIESRIIKRMYEITKLHFLMKSDISCLQDHVKTS